jgi:peptide chain release factor 2
MNDNLKLLKDIALKIDGALKQMKSQDIVEQIDALNQEAQKPDFWQDQSNAQVVNRQISKLKDKIEPWWQLKKQVAETIELIGLNDETINDEVASHAQDFSDQFNKLNHTLLYSGPYDDYDAIMTIYAGAGGTDAQDWAQMLLRMYARWVEKSKGLGSKIIDQSSGEEAGLKSVTLEIDGSLVYGKLKGEQGVHRLVRLSPFNADHLRQTSFARVEVMPKIDQPGVIVIDDKDLKIDVFRAGGHGGQSVNTTDSAVRITHLPTNITVTIQNERSQLQNKETALTILRSKLVQLQLEQHKEKIDELKGPNEQAAWGNQIRNYVLHPYNMVKDLRTKFETSDTQSVLDGEIDSFIEAYLKLL